MSRRRSPARPITHSESASTDSQSSGAALTVLGLVFFVNIFGQSLQLSHWVLDISPFTHVPRLPGGTVNAAPLLWLSVLAVTLCVIGMAGLRRRDIG